MDNIKQEYDITGMSCAACAAHITKAVSKVNGTQDVNVNLLMNKMSVEIKMDQNFKSSKEASEAIEKAVAKAGYGARLKGSEESFNANDKNKTSAINEINNTKNQLIRLILSLSLWIILMYVAMGGMTGIYPPLLQKTAGLPLKAYFELLLTVPIMVINGIFFKRGFRQLYMKSPGMDSLIALGATVSFAYSLFSMAMLMYAAGTGNSDMAVKYSDKLYFESAGTILTLISFGKYLEAASKKKTLAAIGKLVRLAPQTAIVVRDGKDTKVNVGEVKYKDIVIVKEGQSVPLDGIIVSGNGLFDESMLTGESMPVSKTKGDVVTGGTINREGCIRFEVERTGNDTTLAKIIALVEEAGSSKAPVSRLADRISGFFVPIVIGISLLTFIIWLLLSHDVGTAISFAASVLVISCPCALGLATPAAIMAGTGAGAANGILVKSAESLETANSIDTIVLDKTGTVTEGKPIVTSAYFLNTDEALLAAYSLERNSAHPIASAVLRYAKENTNLNNLDKEEVTDYVNEPGSGISGIFKGNKYYIGNNAVLSDDNEYDIINKEIMDAKEHANTILYVTKNGCLLGFFAIADAIKKDSSEAVDLMVKMGLDIIMLTGDNAKTASMIAKVAGIKNCISEVLPQDKERIIEDLRNKGHRVAMVGDGINDAPALIAADVGIAIGAGSDIAIDSADIVLMKNSLMDVPKAIKLSKDVMRNIKENLFWAFFYNIICIPAAAGALYVPFGIRLNPMIGAAAMSFSSLFVVANALRLRFFGNSSYIYQKNGNTEVKTINKKIKKENSEMEKTISIEGMMCKNCAAHVTKALNAIDGVKAEVSLENKNARVTLTSQVSDEALKKAVEEEGYKVTAIK